MERYEESAESLAAAIRGGGAPPSDAYRVCLLGISASVRARYSRLGRRDADEIAADAVSELFEALTQNRDVDKPGAWMLGAASNMALTRLASLTRSGLTQDPQVSSGEIADESPEVAAIIDALADKARVRAAIRAALADEDRTVVRVVVSWLDLYERSNDAPASRAVGKRAGISHQGVADALRRFGEYLSRIPETRQ